MQGDQVKPTAFSSRDLSGEPDAHVSVDRHDLAVRSTMEETATRQRSKANGIDLFRELALIGRLPCGSVREIEFEGISALEVIPVPVPGNDAHCGIRNSTSNRRKSFLAEVRGKLARLASPPVSFDDAY